MAYLTDIEIAQQCEMKPIMEIAKKAHVDEKYVEQYGRYKAKIDPALIDETDRKPGKLVLVTAITPHPRGRGQDHDHHRPGGRPEPHRQGRDGCPA